MIGFNSGLAIANTKAAGLIGSIIPSIFAFKARLFKSYSVPFTKTKQLKDPDWEKISGPFLLLLIIPQLPTASFFSFHQIVFLTTLSATAESGMAKFSDNEDSSQVPTGYFSGREINWPFTTNPTPSLYNCLIIIIY